MLKNNLGIVLLGILIGILLLYSPQIDPKIAIIPFDKNTGKFYGEVHLWCKVVYYAIPWITALLVILPLINWLFNKKIGVTSLAQSRHLVIVVIVSLLLGPGLLVNTIFKDNWGRPRPYQVIRDGKTYKPFWQPNFQEPKNNSFPCGHASIGFFLGVPLLALGYRRRGLVVSCLGGSFVGMVRIMQGGHYLSDVIFAGIFVWGSAEMVVYMVDLLRDKGYLSE